MKEHIISDIFQAVPFKGLLVPRPSTLLTFFVICVPSIPHLIYFILIAVNFSSLALVQSYLSRCRIITHPIAGTVKRGKSLEEDAELAAELRSSLKDRAEHVMLVYLARSQPSL